MPLARLFTIAIVLTAGLLLPNAAQAQGPPCPCTVFAPTDAPGGNALEDSPIEVVPS